MYRTHQGFKDPQDSLIPQAQERLPACQSSNPGMSCQIQGYNGEAQQGASYNWGPGMSGYEMYVRGYIRVVAVPEQCVALSHEPNPITGATGSTNEEDCSCAPGWISSGGIPGEKPFDCVIPEQQPEECLEIGEFYNPRTQQCVTECPHGRLDSQCLAEPETECDESSGDYQGTVGWGENQRPVCAGDNQCQDNETYAFRENAEGSWAGRCISNETNPPVCPKGFEGALIITDGGFACEGLNPDPDNPDDPNDTSDGDSDGDGEGDTTGISGQLQDIKKLLSGGNTERTNIKNKLDGIGKSIKDGASAITDAIGNIPGGGGGDSGGDGDGETPDPVSWSGDAINTELTDPSDDYDQVMADYQAKINEIKGEVQAMFSTNLTGGGSVDDDIKNIKGVDVNFSLNRFLSGLNILGAIVLFCAAFISAGILFTSRG